MGLLNEHRSLVDKVRVRRDNTSDSHRCVMVFPLSSGAAKQMACVQAAMDPCGQSGFISPTATLFNVRRNAAAFSVPFNSANWR